ncbi:MAG: ABC transporter permease [Chitinophagales bacterium]|nr:ABC transporter permease [Chitinophagales bacterium]
MNTPLHIARKIVKGHRDSFSRFIIKVAISANVLSIAVMVMAVCMGNGFTKEIREKVFGFWGHIQITRLQNNPTYDTNPIKEDSKLLKSILSVPNVESISPYINKAGIIKTQTDMEGIMLKGIDESYQWSFLKKYISQGQEPQITSDSMSRDILISTSTAQKLQLEVGDALIIYFLDDNNKRPIGRKLKVSGLYHTGLEEYDSYFALGDLKLIQDLNQWPVDEYGGFEVKVKDLKQLNDVANSIYEKVPSDINVETIREAQPNIFDWLDLIFTNEILALILMLIVAIFNMITALMILILDRTNMIGILKALGATHQQLRQIFIYNALYILGYGLLIGNAIGIGFCWLQKIFGIIKLDESLYYFKEVPVRFDWLAILGINLITVILTLIVLLIPTMIISKISPLKAIRYD